jgi:hypothetical protein
MNKNRSAGNPRRQSRTHKTKMFREKNTGRISFRLTRDEVFAMALSRITILVGPEYRSAALTVKP